MEILKHIKLRGKKFPLVKTPLTDKEKWQLNKEYGRYVVHDVSNVHIMYKYNTHNV